MIKERPECPQCGEDLRNSRTQFCPSCRFPLMLVAGKYQFETLLDKGGFSLLYEATHTGLSQGNKRVIKVLKSDLFDEGEEQVRFEREVELTMLLSLENEHIVQIFDDFGQIPNLGCYFVMEKLRGCTLKHILRKGKELDVKLAFHIFRQLCFALHAAHLRDIVHRDLKPANIFLIQRETNPFFVKLLDFGIARPIIDKHNEDVTKQAIGTPDYMSPEQCLNRAVDARSDVYSLAILLYRLLTGVTPYHEEKKNAGGSALPVLQAQVTKPAPLMRTTRPDLDIQEGLDNALQKALSKDPKKRYASARELWDAVAQFAPPTSFEMLKTFQDGMLQQVSSQQPANAQQEKNKHTADTLPPPPEVQTPAPDESTSSPKPLPPPPQVETPSPAKPSSAFDTTAPPEPPSGTDLTALPRPPTVSKDDDAPTSFSAAASFGFPSSQGSTPLSQSIDAAFGRQEEKDKTNPFTAAVQDTNTKENYLDGMVDLDDIDDDHIEPTELKPIPPEDMGLPAQKADPTYESIQVVPAPGNVAETIQQVVTPEMMVEYDDNGNPINEPTPPKRAPRRARMSWDETPETFQDKLKLKAEDLTLWFSEMKEHAQTPEGRKEVVLNILPWTLLFFGVMLMILGLLRTC